MNPPLNKAELTIIVLMRIMGVGGLLAVPAIFLPHSWMNSIHEFMGLGTMPDTPIISYLARSLSSFYAVVGTFTLYVSLDIRRQRAFVRLWAIIVTIMSVVLFGIDMASGMPPSWTLGEGPPMLVIGVILLWCERHIQESAVHSLDR